VPLVADARPSARPIPWGLSPGVFLGALLAPGESQTNDTGAGPPRVGRPRMYLSGAFGLIHRHPFGHELRHGLGERDRVAGMGAFEQQGLVVE